MFAALITQQVLFAAVGLWFAMRAGVWDGASLELTWWAVVGGVGLAGGLAALMKVSWRLFPVTMQRLDQTIVEFWSKIDLQWTPFTIVALSVAAGVGEELLFRATIQVILVKLMPVAVGLLLAALLFGLAHWLSREYVLITGAIGLLFGVVFHLTGSLLLVIIAHIVYDVWALGRLGARLSVVP